MLLAFQLRVLALMGAALDLMSLPLGMLQTTLLRRRIEKVNRKIDTMQAAYDRKVQEEQELREEIAMYQAVEDRQPDVVEVH